MVRWAFKTSRSPIGVDVGSRSIKMVQFNSDGSRLLEVSRWDLPNLNEDDLSPEEAANRLTDAIAKAREGRDFRGNRVVMCLNSRELFLQNVRVPKLESADVDQLVHQEAAGRVPFSVAEAELRFLEAGTVRQGESSMREIILLACHRPALDRAIEIVERAGLRPQAIDAEPIALLRAYTKQFRRDEDRQSRTLFVHVGYSNTAVVIAQGDDMLFVKYIDVGGRQMDDAVEQHLNMSSHEAVALRRHNGDRRAEKQDPEITASVSQAIRPVVERLAGDLSMCIRYHSVTFRGKPLSRLVLGGGEASISLLAEIEKRIDIPCELGDPFRNYASQLSTGRRGQWDVAAGLALRSVNVKS